MASFHFDLVSPAKLVFSGEVEQVDVPGIEGDFGVLAGHAPYVAVVKPGFLTVHGDGEPQRFVVLGGFAEVSPDGLTVLADVATTIADVDRAAITVRIKELEESVEKIEEGSLLDRAIQKLDHFKDVDQHLQTTAMH
jgi:F-type H+-transporting ATPase subunit epsilon